MTEFNFLGNAGQEWQGEKLEKRRDGVKQYITFRKLQVILRRV